MLTGQQDYRFCGVEVVHSAEQALDVATEAVNAAKAKGGGFEGEETGSRAAIAEIMVIGGAHIYELFLPQAQRLYLTRVHADIEGDVYFPALIMDEWRQLSREDFAAQGENPYAYSFITFERHRISTN